MATTDKIKAKRRHAKIMLWSVVFIVVSAMVLPLTGYLYVDLVATSATAADAQQSNPRANYWRAVREGGQGYTAASGPYTTDTLVNNSGQNWRQIRNGPVATYSAIALAVVAGLLLLYMLVRGQVKVEGPSSGRSVERWSAFNRFLHWYTAILFIVLAITGLSLLFGRAVLIPLMGPEGFSGWAQFSRWVHDYLGPFFSIGVVLILILWLPFNLPEKTDGRWLRKSGGLLGKEHPDCGRINAGEKIFTYGSMLVLGLAVVITGFILDFPNYGQTRDTMQLANVIHGGASVLWIALMLGHIYLGLWGVEGTLPAMTQGKVSSEWARQHHNLWYDEVKHTETSDTSKAPSGAVGRTT